MPRVFPLDKPLAYSTLLDRLKRYADVSGALRFYRTPSQEAAYRVLAKDNIGVAQWPTSAGSQALINLQLPDADIVTQLLHNGCDIFGKTHLTELAGFVTINALAFGYSHLGGAGRNPHGSFPTGGSSVGSAVAVAMGLCDAALGTETRGSLMVPAFRNGIWAYKPTVGRYSRRGIIPLSRHFDTPGWLARDPDTLAALDRLSQQSAPNDADAEEHAVQLQSAPVSPVTRVGLLIDPTLTPEAKIRLERWCDAARRSGLEIVPIEPPSIDFGYAYLVGEAFLQDMTAFLGMHARDGQPRSAVELIERYRADPRTHPYGMERLENALTQPHLTPEALDALALTARRNARSLIATLCQTHAVDALACTAYLDWWAIGAAPSIAVPVDKLTSGQPMGVLIGTRAHEDDRLLVLAQTLSALSRTTPATASSTKRPLSADRRATRA